MTYDFIIVGGGPAGSALAWKLSSVKSPPSILLLEAGGTNSDKSARVDGERWTTRLIPGMNWGYKSTPQPWLDNREIDYDRGKGLGGSTAINFGIYQMPPKGDFEEIVRLVGDDAWSWENAVERHKELENYQVSSNKEYRDYLQPASGIHGTSGPLKIGHPEEAEKQCIFMLDVMSKSSFAKNLDSNDGNGIGFSLVPQSAHKGMRSTARDLLYPTPSNLTIITDTQVDRILFKGKRAVGVVAGDKEFFASKEVIISAGSIDTPKLLMLSGIGPAKHLESHGIPVILDSPRVGKGMRDHPYCALVYERTPETTDRPALLRDAERRAAAKKQWEQDGTGDLSTLATCMIMGLVKNDAIYQSEEFKQLPADVRRYLQHDTVPLYEFIVNSPNFAQIISPSTAMPLESIFMFLYNTQSEGEILLTSGDPAAPPAIDAKMFSDPFDRRVAIEAARELMKFASEEAFAKDTVGGVDVPKSTSDDDIWEFWATHGSTVWHPTGTVKMGNSSDLNSVVSTDFKITDIEGLRVADMSVAPVIVNSHPQSFAYIIGLTAAYKILREYGL